jgi:dolichyl-phosphate-mannose-protein mannosyltransferase
MILLAASLVMLGAIAVGLDRLIETGAESRATKLTRMSLWAVATVVIVEISAGAVGLLKPGVTFVVLTALAGAIVAVARRRVRTEAPPRQPLSAADVGLAAALVAAFALRLWAGLHKTTFLYDTLSYHLHVPATWMHDARVGIVPAIFGDPSPAYAPSNIELVFAFLMAPLRSDYLAGVGQLPLAALAVAAIVASVREAGGHRAAALGAALAFVLIPEVWGQMATAMTDLGLAAFLIASLPFSIRLGRRTEASRSDLFALAAALGLGVGSKYAGATLAVPFLALGLIAAIRARRFGFRDVLAAGGIVLATGGFWYVRNTLVAGNPFYPVAVPGLPLPALYGAREMRAWEYHLPVSDLAGLGSMLVAAGVGFVSAAAISIARLWRSVEAALVVTLLAIFWFVVPYQESRFLFSALAIAAIAIGRAADRPPAIVGWCGLAIAIVGSLLEGPTPDRLLLLPIGAIAAVAFARLRHQVARAGVRTRYVAASVAAIAVIAALGAGASRYAGADPGYTVGDDRNDAWSWLRANVRDARVAYTGTNLAFPLAGERLANRVTYVNVAGAPGDRLHDFGPPGDGTAEPAPYRRNASADVWLANLRATRVQILFAASLYRVVDRSTCADDPEVFPIERTWADARPEVFSLLYSTAAARIYAVNPP